MGLVLCAAACKPLNDLATPLATVPSTLPTPCAILLTANCLSALARSGNDV